MPPPHRFKGINGTFFLYREPLCNGSTVTLDPPCLQPLHKRDVVAWLWKHRTAKDWRKRFEKAGLELVEA